MERVFRAIQRLKIHAVCTTCVALVAPRGVCAADSIVTGIVAQTPTVAAGTNAMIKLGITANDGTTWAADTVDVYVDLLAQDGTTVATSDLVHPTEDVAASRSTFVFVGLPTPPQATGAYTARANVRHNGSLVAFSDTVGLAIGTIVAQPPPASERSSPLTGQISSNEIFSARSQQAGAFAFTGKYAGTRSYTANLGLSSSPGAQKPVLTIQTLGSIVQLGTFAPTFDSLVFGGANGTGVSYKRVGAANQSLSYATISGAHATANPFTLTALSYALPVAGGTIALTVGNESTLGTPPAEATTFVHYGTIAGLAFAHPTDSRGFAYGIRYGTIDYDDGVSEKRRTDRAIGANLGFPIFKSSWTLDVLRAGPYFPNVSAPGITPDHETESLQGTIPLGVASLTVGVNGSRDQLYGSPSTQNAHVYTENVGVNVPLRNGDQLGVNASNSIQHRAALADIASGNDNTSLSYAGRRGATNFSFTLGSANQRDNSGNLQHTVQDAITLGRTFGSLVLGVGASFTGNHANASAQTSLLQAFNANASYSRGPLTLSSQYNRSNTVPYLGTAPVPTTGINYGLTFKPAGARTSLQATLTQSHGASTSSNGSLNLAREL